MVDINKGGTFKGVLTVAGERERVEAERRRWTPPCAAWLWGGADRASQRADPGKPKRGGGGIEEA